MIRHIYISIAEQRLFFFTDGRCEKSFLISTAKNGPGEQEGSYCTPRGWHSIADIIGLDAPINTVFKARQSTGQIYTAELEAQFPNEDWILTRIIRLKGQEIGFNLGKNYDTYNRYIYLHGCSENSPMGQPASHGCIRMKNHDVAELAAWLRYGDSVFIG
ncbi:MAG: L,D-transpeptidase [Pseudomonadota bacterium]